MAKPLILIVGAGYVGTGTAASLAWHNSGKDILICDRDKECIKHWQSANITIGRVHESIEGYLFSARDKDSEKDDAGKVSFSHIAQLKPGTADWDDISPRLETVFLCVNLPVGSDEELDAANIISLAPLLIHLYEKHVYDLVIRSTMTPRALQAFRQELNKCYSHITLREEAWPGLQHLVLLPEFLPQGSSISEYTSPEMTLVGGSACVRAALRVLALWRPVELAYKVVTSCEAAMLGKLGTNGMLAAKLTCNNILNACLHGNFELPRAHVDLKAWPDALTDILSLDARLGRGYLTPALLGFGGVCLKKDVTMLASIAADMNEPVLAHFWNSLLAVNARLVQRAAEGLVTHMKGTNLRRLGIAGLGFKAESTDMRDSQVVALIKALIDLCRLDPDLNGVKLLLYDARPQTLHPVAIIDERIVICEDLDEFRTADFSMVQRGLDSVADRLELDREPFIWF